MPLKDVSSLTLCQVRPLTWEVCGPLGLASCSPNSLAMAAAKCWAMPNASGNVAGPGSHFSDSACLCHLCLLGGDSNPSTSRCKACMAKQCACARLAVATNAALPASRGQQMRRLEPKGCKWNA